MTIGSHRPVTSPARVNSRVRWIVSAPHVMSGRNVVLKMALEAAFVMKVTLEMELASVLLIVSKVVQLSSVSNVLCMLFSKQQLFNKTNFKTHF